MRDYLSSIAPVRLISPAAAVTDNTPFVSQIVDLAGYEGFVAIINLGSLADADATFTVLLEHGNQANLSDAATPTATQLTGTAALASFTFAEDNKVRMIGYVGPKRYVRLTITPANNTGNAFISAVGVKFGSRYRPTANPPA